MDQRYPWMKHDMDDFFFPYYQRYTTLMNSFRGDGEGAVLGADG